MKLFIIVVLSSHFLISIEALKGKAQLTFYYSYALCCKENPNYDPKASPAECTDYSAW
jgi:hypothetical protein